MRRKNTVYLDEEMELRLAAIARSTGVTKAELIRRYLAKGIEEARREERPKPFPTFKSMKPMTVEEMDEAIYQSMKRRVSKR
ncbi:ribbon-helix-helix protein, CopG family [Glycomyces tenuis]|uniref:ribbon-helix-helix protein, CopG family n=1 Tax=Glycomyces tenuis TaxID=58116 RepID=UPI00040963C0|nr:ribbon-helix-helix protein, CopG family [Glycomyces tenuis]